MSRGFGVAGGLDPEVASPLAARCQELGYASVWSNDTPIGNAHFLAANVRTGVRPLLVQAGKPDVVVIDPPRAGLSQKMIRRVIECEAKKIVYVSCNPTTLAPNAAQLVEAGYKLTRVRPVDMFPQTPHIECVALLEKA